ncbi:MAG TPA: hypothetical protein VEI24_00295 [Nitrospiria bacterium]|nr:hypothetical protein [Nitrospiria bacterium]
MTSKTLARISLVAGTFVAMLSACHGASQDGGLSGVVVFVETPHQFQQIFSKRLPDGPEANLSNNSSQDRDPDLSSDGSRIVFASDRSGSTQIWVMDSDGKHPQQLTDDNEGGQSPRWSRDGKEIAFARGRGDVAVMNADGSGVHVIMQAEDEASAEPCRAGAFPGGWSTDDSHITYYSASVTRSIAQLCTIRADGSDIQVIVADPNAYDEEGVYSPDGAEIVYRAIINGQHDIWVVDLATGDRRNLTNDADVDIEPSWSPDGQWIIFGSLKPGEPNFDLYAMRGDGSGVTRITSDPAKDSNPVWGP